MGRKRINAIHGYFTYDLDNKTSTCVKCNKVLQGSHASNLLRHYHSQHRKYYDEIIKINETNTSLENVKEHSPSSKIIECCLDLVTVHGRPFSMLEDIAFQELVNMIPSAKGLSISAKSIKCLITERAYEIRKAVFNEIKEKLISLKVDVGSVKTRRFLGLNIQYIHNGKIVLRNLGVIELHENNTGKYLKEIVLYTLSHYGIEAQNIYSITTDNGSNMLSMSHQIDQAVEEDFEILEEDLECLDDVNNSDLSIIDELDFQFDVSHEQSPGTRSFRPKVVAVRCAAHTLQLAINDALKENEELLQIVRQAARALRAPNIATQLRNLHLLQAIIDCPTRWDSTADMLERILSLKRFCLESSDSRINLSESIWKGIEDTISALKSCRILSKRLQCEQLTFGDFLISWTQCCLETENLGTPFSILVAICMRNRESNLFQNESFLAAVYLDPRVNFVLSDEQLIAARNHLILTYQRLFQITSVSANTSRDTVSRTSIETVPDAAPSTSREAVSSTSKDAVPSFSIESGTGSSAMADEAAITQPDVSLKEVDSFLQELYQTKRSGIERTQFDIQNLLVNFLNEPLLKSDRNILEYWSKNKFIHPHLYSLANIVLSTPPTQVSVERLFSSLKFVMNNLRMSLKDKNINDILVVRNNSLYTK